MSADPQGHISQVATPSILAGVSWCLCGFKGHLKWLHFYKGMHSGKGLTGGIHRDAATRSEYGLDYSNCIHANEAPLSTEETKGH